VRGSSSFLAMCGRSPMALAARCGMARGRRGQRDGRFELLTEGASGSSSTKNALPRRTPRPTRGHEATAPLTGRTISAPTRNAGRANLPLHSLPPTRSGANFCFGHQVDGPSPDARPSPTVRHGGRVATLIHAEDDGRSGRYAAQSISREIEAGRHLHRPASWDPLHE
jgi:hypothetical protein